MKKLLLILLSALCITNATAQLSTKERPVSFSFDEELLSKMKSSVDIRTMPELDMDAIEKEDAVDDEYDYPPRFGYPHKVDLNLDNSGTWTVLPNGDKIWQLMIACPKALSINLLYDKYWIPEGGKLFIYTRDKKHSIGAFTNINNKGNKDNIQGFATGLLYGDTITLEYYQPSHTSEDAIISIAYVIHGYRYINIGEQLERSGNCHVNVNCPEGDNWQNEKRAIALVLVNGYRYCSGSLVTTTSDSYQPLFLTANHCLGGWANTGYAGVSDPDFQYDAVNNPILNHWSFYWNYETPGCGNSSYAPDSDVTNGAIVLANNDTSDFALLRLTEDPKNTIIPYYLGWDRSGNSGTGGVGIHHPSGDYKKISTYSCTPQTVSFNSSLPVYWGVQWASTVNGHGTTEEGSSGSPLLNNSHRVLGQLRGSNTGCTNLNGTSKYGKFSESWTGNGNSTDKLSCWLDPTNIGLTVTNGSYPTSIVGDNFICSSKDYYVRNLPSGYSVTWSLSDSYYNNSPNWFLSNCPYAGYCRIIRVNGHDLMNATLTAEIKYNSVTIQTLTKSGIYAYAGFWGQFTSGGLSGNINSSGFFNIKKNSFTTITSPNFCGATVSYSSSGATPSSWSFNSSTGVLSFYVSNITIPVILNVHDGCENDYVIYAYPSSLYSIDVCNGESGITVLLVEDGDVSKDFTPDEPWTIEIINTESGRVMTTLSSTNRSETISTAGWPKGIYIVKVTVGKEELTEKVMVK